MVHDYEVFELLIGLRNPNGYPLTVIQSPVGEGIGICTLNALDEELHDAITAIIEKNTDKDFLIEFGQFLFCELFVGDIETIYRLSLSAARAQSKLLRIQLRIEPPEVATIPWEYLHDPEEDGFLAIGLEIAVARYVPVRLPTRRTKVLLPLRILVAISSPCDWPRLDVALEKNGLTATLADQVQAGNIILKFLEHTSPSLLRQAILTFQPHVFHFIGHSEFVDDQGSILFEDEEQRALPITEDVFREFFASARETRLIVLNSCQTASSSKHQQLAGLAARLLQRQLAAVIAMQAPIQDEVAALFAREFYQSIGLGYPIDAALTEARKGLYTEWGADSPDWGIPILFLRAKDGQLFDLQQGSQERIPAIPDPPEPMRPPEIENFVGRETELASYIATLNQTGIAVIAGMAGIGKTSLMARLALAMKPTEKIFWCQFRQGEGIINIIWKLAAFAAWHGNQDFWHMLQGAQLTNAQLPPIDILLDYALQAIRNRGYLLCFDDFHLIEDGINDDPVLNQIGDRLRPAVAGGELQVIIASRRVPSFVRLSEFQPLSGLTVADAKALLASRKVTLSDEQIAAILAATEGNSELMIMALDAIKRVEQPANLIFELLHARSIERFLLEELDQNLTNDERDVESGIAVLGMPSTRDAIEATLNRDVLHSIFHDLCARFLLTLHTTQQGRHYDQHGILQAFYYSVPSRLRREEMHRAAANYYAEVVKEPLHAANHYLRAGDFAIAAALLANNVWQYINQGQVHLARHYLEQFNIRQLAPLDWVRVNLAVSELYTYLQQNTQATEALNEAITTLELLPVNQDTQRLFAYTYRGLAQSLASTDPQKARQWIERGLDELQDIDHDVRADLLIKQGTYLTETGNYDEALTAILTGLELLPDGQSRTRMGAYLNLGAIYSYRGEFALGQLNTQKALTLARASHAYHWMIRILYNLGFDLYFSGEWAQAEEHYLESLALAKRLGNVAEEANVMNFLGMLYTRQGRVSLAYEQLQSALRLTEQTAISQLKCYVLSSLAGLSLLQGNFAEVATYLAEAKAIAIDLGINYVLVEILLVQSEMDLAEGQITAAENAVEEALALADSLNLSIEMGIGYRLKGQIAVQKKSTPKVIEYFQQSVALLDARDPYQVACTKKVWGEFLLLGEDAEWGRSLQTEATQILTQLGIEESSIRQRI